MSIDTALAALAVPDLAEAKSFYTRLLGRAPDLEPMPTLAQWNLESGGVQVVEQPDLSGHSMLTLLVSDFETVHQGLVDGGFTPLEPVAGVVSRLTQITDPAGNVITVTEAQ